MNSYTFQGDLLDNLARAGYKIAEGEGHDFVAMAEGDGLEYKIGLTFHEKNKSWELVPMTEAAESLVRHLRRTTVDELTLKQQGIDD